MTIRCEWHILHAKTEEGRGSAHDELKWGIPGNKMEASMTRMFSMGQRVKVIDFDEPYFRGKYPYIETRAGQTGIIISPLLISEAGSVPKPPNEPIVDEYYMVKMDEDGDRIKLPPEALNPVN